MCPNWVHTVRPVDLGNELGWFWFRSWCRAIFLPLTPTVVYSLQSPPRPFLRGELEQPLEGELHGYPPSAVEENEASSLSPGCRMLMWGECPGLP